MQNKKVLVISSEVIPYLPQTERSINSFKIPKQINRVRVELVRSVGLDWDHELIRRRGHLREEERVLQKHASEGP